MCSKASNKNIAVFASGNGSNYEAVAQAVQDGQISGKLVLLFTDKRSAFALERARKFDTPTASFSPKEFTNKKEYEETLLELLEQKQVDLIVLAGYMRIVGPTLLEKYEGRIINIHPALLPNFPGAHGIEDAFKAGVSETGVTVHYIDAGVDSGPVIAQEKVQIESVDTLETLETKIHAIEHQLYPKVIEEIIQKGSVNHQ